MIKDLRSVFSGSLTYAANWGPGAGEYRRVLFWDALDFVGINAYFPLTNRPDPQISDLVAGWQRYTPADGGRPEHWLDDLVVFSQSVGKPLVLTEIGYPSHADAVQRPWDFLHKAAPKYSLQADAYVEQSMADRRIILLYLYDKWSSWTWLRDCWPGDLEEAGFYRYGQSESCH